MEGGFQQVLVTNGNGKQITVSIEGEEAEVNMKGFVFAHPGEGEERNILVVDYSPSWATAIEEDLDTILSNAEISVDQISIPIIFRPSMVMPKPGQPDKRRFIVNLSWESELTRRGLSDPLAPNSFTDQEYFEVAEWMSCSMCGEAIEIMREIGKLADPGLVPSESFARGGGGL